MAHQSELREARFERSGHRSEGTKGSSCGFPACDFSEVVRVRETGEEYRYCEKLGMRVSDDDFCKYHQNKEWDKLMDWTARVIIAEQKAINKSKVQATPKQETIPAFRLILVAVFCAALFWLLK